MRTPQALTCTLLLTLPLCGVEPRHDRLDAATEAVQEIMAISDRGVPQNLLDRSQCLVVVPGLKAGAFVVGAKYGRGFVTCRKRDGIGWTAPGSVRIEGGSVGFQIGGKETDLLMLVMNEKGARRLMSSQFTLGGDVTVAAGPVGRDSTAQTDLTLRAEILSYSRSRGAFAGLSLQGATLRQDSSTNRELYGRDVTNRDLMATEPAPPEAAQGLLATLERYSSRRVQ